MRRIVVFNNVTLDGYYTGLDGDMSWAHKYDPEWMEFTNSNAKGGAVLAFGRKTYDMMAGYWPTPQAKKDNPVVANGMNAAHKVVFSRSLDKATWANTKLLKGDLVAEVKKLKAESPADLVLMGSGQIVAQLASAGLVDRFTLPTIPVVLGKGRSMFDGVEKRFDLKLAGTRAFKNGVVVLTYERSR